MRKVLVVDDDVSILEGLKRLLSKEPNIDARFYLSPISALEELKNGLNVDLIIVDMWISEMDGLLFIKHFREFNETTPVLSMSGHANLDSNFEIAKLGADDFIEKPFNKAALLYKIRRMLGDSSSEKISLIDNSSIARLIHENKKKKQRTIEKNGVLTGKGIHTGSKTGIILSPLPENSGVIFEDIVSGKQVLPHIQNIHSKISNTGLGYGDFSLSVIEHLMATFFAYEIDNILVKVNKEIPALDGSAIEFCHLMDGLGLIEQNAYKKEIVIDKKYQITDEKDPSISIQVEPYDGFSIAYHFEYEDGTKTVFDIDLSENRTEIFKKEIAPARTFVSLTQFRDVILANGLGQGITTENTLFLKNGVIFNQELRFPDELARHKGLDLCGDSMLLCLPLKGRFTAFKTGHRHNAALLKAVLSS